MAFDIYGENLRAGHCEVHPHVHESYPCSLCFAEANNQQQGEQGEQEYSQETIDDHYRNQYIYHIIGACLV